MRDLSPHLTYATSRAPASERNRSIGDPRGVAWNGASTRAYVTGTGSNNLAVLVGQGPTGLALQESRRRALVLDRFDATISVVLPMSVQGRYVGAQLAGTQWPTRSARRAPAGGRHAGAGGAVLTLRRSGLLCCA